MSSATKFIKLMDWIEEHADIVPEEFHDIREFGRFHRPVCSTCQTNMYPYKNGVWLIDTFLDPPEAYQIWSADEWACPICEAKIVDGFSNRAVQHHEKEFQSLLALAKSKHHIYSFETVEQARKMLAINGRDLIPGKWVDIYRKPLTGEEFEGRARLKTRLPDIYNDPGIQYWEVLFPDNMLVERTIMEQFANASSEE